MLCARARCRLESLAVQQEFFNQNVILIFTFNHNTMDGYNGCVATPQLDKSSGQYYNYFMNAKRVCCVHEWNEMKLKLRVKNNNDSDNNGGSGSGSNTNR